MARIPTESRIFANRYFREARRVEALHAARLSPGTHTWREALRALFERMEKAGSPIKQAAVLRQAIAALNGIDQQEAMHIGIVAGGGRKRSAGLMFATFSAGWHPLGLDEEGLRVLQHGIVCSRTHATLLADVVLAYVSRHAVSRLHERDHRLTAAAAFGVFGFIGVLGMISHRSKRHERGGMCLRYGDILAVGSIKHGVDVGAFFDVRTVLPANEVRDSAMLAQGAAAYDAVKAWLPGCGSTQLAALAEKIPPLPRREDDYTLRSQSQMQIGENDAQK